MKFTGFRKRTIFIASICMSTLLGFFHFTPCAASDQPGKRTFLRNLSKIRQPGQKLHFIVYDTATYFGLSDAEKIDLLKLLEAIWAEPVSGTHGLTLKEHGSLNSFLINAFKDTLRNYGWTDDEKRTVSNLKQLYFDTERMNIDTAVGREIRERWVQYKADMKRGEEGRTIKGVPKLRADIIRDSIEAEQKEEKRKRAIEAQARWEEASKNLPVPTQRRMRPFDMGVAEFYHGLTEKEVVNLFKITKPIFADLSPEGQELKGRVSRFLVEAFRDTLRTHGWTDEEKLRLEGFRKEADKLGLYQLTEDQMLERQKRYKEALRDEPKK